MNPATFDRYKCLDPAAVAKSFADAGWWKASEKSGVVGIWCKREAKALLPLDPNAPNYPNMTIDALKIFAKVEYKTESQVLDDLLNPASIESVTVKQLLNDLNLERQNALNALIKIRSQQAYFENSVEWSALKAYAENLDFLQQDILRLAKKIVDS